MMIKILYHLLVGLTLTCSVAAQAADDLPLGAELPKIETLGNPSPWLLAKVSSVVDSDYYGTAVLFAADAEHYFFVTNAHVLPVAQDGWADLRLLSPLKNYQQTAFTVVGITYGYDLAVLALPRERADRAERSSLEMLVSRVFDARDASEQEMQIALVGFPGYPATNQRIVPSERRDFLDDDLRAARGEQRYPVARWSYPTTVSADDDCPPHFLQRCYHVPIISWGFSGGALMGLPRDSVTWPQQRIFGIVSHFEPLSDKTHVIPIDVALRQARSFVERWHGTVVIDAEDESGTFRESTPGTVEILKGPLTGTKLAPADEGRVPGGHESVGGGHESVGGGGSSSGETLYSTTTGNAAFLGHWRDLLDTVGAPAAWGDATNPFGQAIARLKPIRGVLTSLRYQPGVVATEPGGTPILRQSYGPYIVTTTQSFLRRYRSDMSAGWTTAQEPAAAPTDLHMRDDTRRGSHSFDFLGRFRTPIEISEMVAKGRLTNSPSGFEIAELSPLMAAHNAADGRKDLIIGKGNESFRGLITKASLTTEAGKTTIRVTSPSATGDIAMTFAGMLAPAGPDLYRYAGPVRIATATRLWTTGERYEADGFGVLMLQKTGSGYEMKLLVAHVKDIEPEVTVIDQSLMTRDQIVVDGMFIPFD